MNSLKIIISTFIILIMAGCTIVDGGAIVTGVTRNPIPVNQVRIYRVAPKKYEEIAMVSASAGHDFKSSSDLLNTSIMRLKEEAAKLGANGVLLSQINERDAPSTSTSIGSAYASGNDGSSAYASGSSISVNRGDAYTRIKGLAIYVP